MNGQEIITQFNNFVEDELDQTTALILISDAVHEVEEEVQPLILKKVDVSKSTAAGQTSATAIDLPTDIFLPPDEISIGSSSHYKQIPIDQQVKYRDTAGYFWIDWVTKKYHLTGIQNSVQIISFPYWYETNDITLTTSPVWPDRFHRLVPLKMAKLYFYIDQGDKTVNWSPEWASEYERQLLRFKDWDAKLKLKALHGQTPYPDDEAVSGPNKISL